MTIKAADLVGDETRTQAILMGAVATLQRALQDIDEAVRCRLWVTDGRGPYEWDDDRYKEEAGDALRQVLLLSRQAMAQTHNILSGRARPVIQIRTDLDGPIAALERLTARINDTADRAAKTEERNQHERSVMLTEIARLRRQLVDQAEAAQTPKLL